MPDDESMVRERLRQLIGRRSGDASASPGLSAPRPAEPERHGDAPSGDPDDVLPSAAAGTDPAALPSRFGGLSAFDPGRRGVKALAAVAAVVVVGAASYAWWARPRVEHIADPPSDLEVAASVAPPSPTADEIVVSVAGRVRRPGLVRLPPGARVADALDAAGGVLPGTDVTLLNLARRVADGELILVGITPPPGAAPYGLAPGAPEVGGPVEQTGKVNLNTATLAQLDALPGVGPVLAQRILDYRQRHGGFRSVNELRRVEGIGGTRFERLRELVTV